MYIIYFKHSFNMHIIPDGLPHMNGTTHSKQFDDNNNNDNSEEPINEDEQLRSLEFISRHIRES